MTNLDFSVGFLSFAMAFFLAACALIGHALACFGAWLKRTDPPRDRIRVIAGLLAVTGFVLGSFLQPTWNNFAQCRPSQPLLDCVLSSPAR